MDCVYNNQTKSSKDRLSLTSRDKTIKKVWRDIITCCLQHLPSKFFVETPPYFCTKSFSLPCSGSNTRLHWLQRARSSSRGQLCRQVLAASLLCVPRIPTLESLLTVILKACLLLRNASFYMFLVKQCYRIHCFIIMTRDGKKYLAWTSEYQTVITLNKYSIEILVKAS